MSVKSLTRFCLKFNVKIEDLKECFLCNAFKKKEDLTAPVINLPANSINAGLSGHIKFNACKFSQYYDITQLAGKNVLPKSTKKLSSATNIFLKKMHFKPDILIKTINSKWKDIAGEIFFENVVPLKFNRGTLTVKSVSPSVSQNFMFVKDDILKNINSVLTENLVKRIKIQQ